MIVVNAPCVASGVTALDETRVARFARVLSAVLLTREYMVARTGEVSKTLAGPLGRIEIGVAPVRASEPYGSEPYDADP